MSRFTFLVFLFYGTIILRATADDRAATLSTEKPSSTERPSPSTTMPTEKPIPAERSTTAPNSETTSTHTDAQRYMKVCQRTYPNCLSAVSYAACSLECMDIGPSGTLVPYYVDDENGIPCGDQMECLGGRCSLSSRVKQCKAVTNNTVLHVDAFFFKPCNYQCKTIDSSILAFDEDESNCFAIVVYLPFKCLSGTCVQVSGFAG